MKHYLIFIFLIAFFVCSSASARMIQLEKKDWVLDVFDVEIGDYDGDGQPEIAIMLGDQNTTLIRKFSRDNWIGRSIRDIRTVGSDICFTGMEKIDMTSGPGEDLALFNKDILSDSIWVDVRSIYTDMVLCRTEVIKGVNQDDRDSYRYPSWDGTIGGCWTHDIDGDGSKEIILSIAVGYDCYPRGVFVYKYPSGKLMWKFLTAGIPQNLVFSDVNGDSETEIYFSTWACGNECTVGEFKDDISRVWAINSDGKPLWYASQKDAYAFTGSNVQVCDCDQDGVTEIYYTTFENVSSLDSFVCKLTKARAWDNEPIGSYAFTPGFRLGDIKFSDLDRDGEIELIVNEWPTLINPVTMMADRKGNAYQSRPRLIEDIDVQPDSMLEVVSWKKGSLAIFNYEMKRLSTYSVGEGEQIRSVEHYVDPYGRSCLAIISDINKKGQQGNDLYILEATSIGNLNYLLIAFKRGLGKWYVGIIGMLLGAFLGVLAAIQHAKSKFRKSENKLTEPDYRSLLSYLTTFNHGQMAGKNLNRLSLLFGNLPDDEQKIVELRDRVDSAIEGYRSFASEQLTAIIKECKTHEHILEEANSFEANRNTLEELLPESADSVSVMNADHLRDSIPDAIKRLKNDINELYRIAGASFKIDLLHVLRNTLKGLSRRLDQENIIIGDVSVAGNFSRDVFFSESELTAIIEELINNACTAMSGSSEKIIGIEVIYNDDSAILRVSDTGSGIDEKASALLFNRNYSTKSDGGGYGLFHAHQQTQVFSGQIRLYNNDNDGATVEIKLRLS